MSDRRNRDLGPDARVRLGQNVAVHRLRAGLSRGEVGRRALVSGPWLKAAEEGRAGSSLDAWVRLAGALDVTLDDLLEGVAWVPARVEEAGEGGYVLD
jgi:transcriptional regulator with XRE-family HTH domain